MEATWFSSSYLYLILEWSCWSCRRWYWCSDTAIAVVMTIPGEKWHATGELNWIGNWKCWVGRNNLPQTDSCIYYVLKSLNGFSYFCLPFILEEAGSWPSRLSIPFCLLRRGWRGRTRSDGDTSIKSHFTSMHMKANRTVLIAAVILISLPLSLLSLSWPPRTNNPASYNKLPPATATPALIQSDEAPRRSLSIALVGEHHSP